MSDITTLCLQPINDPSTNFLLAPLIDFAAPARIKQSATH
jgi:hypothetical protein